MSDHDILVALQSASASLNSKTTAIQETLDKAVITGINAIHNRLNHKSSGRLGSTKIGQDERRKAYEIWEEAKRKLKSPKTRVRYKDAFESPLFHRRLSMIGITSPQGLQKAVEAYKKTVFGK
jgi:hypothetical protein